MAPEPGSVYSDDASISGDEVLYRVISTGHVVWDGTTPVRVQTNAFQDQNESKLPDLGVPAVAVSVFLHSEVAKSGRTPSELRWSTDHGIAMVTAADVRAQGQGIVKSPKDGSPEHAMVFTLQGAKKSKGQSKRIAETAQILIAPTPPPLV
ncbi:MAG: hypothetical protein H0W25_06630 [Acidimicrobiia bacterium]|nr:hypothetical protein [Acidimicrobiia bacterium]